MNEENEKNVLRWQKKSGFAKRNFLFPVVFVLTSSFLILLLIILMVSQGFFFYPSIIIFIFFVILNFIILYFILKLNYIDEIIIDSDFIKIKGDKDTYEIPIKDAKIYGFLGLKYRSFSGFYIKYKGKWNYLSLDVVFGGEIEKRIKKMPGYRNIAIVISIIMFIIACLVYTLFLR